MKESEVETLRRLSAKLNALIGKTIRFNKNTEKSEIDFDTGMLAVVNDWHFVRNSECDVFSLQLDWSSPEMVEHNARLMKPTYYDKKGVACLKWNELPSYPLKHNSGFYFTSSFFLEDNKKELEFDVVESEPAYDNAVLLAAVKVLKEQVASLEDQIQMIHEEQAGADI